MTSELFDKDGYLKRLRSDLEQTQELWRRIRQEAEELNGEADDATLSRSALDEKSLAFSVFCRLRDLRATLAFYQEHPDQIGICEVCGTDITIRLVAYPATTLCKKHSERYGPCPH